MLGSLICRFSGHKINRKRVWHDGVGFRTECSRCDKALLREQVGWREFDPVEDTGIDHEDHPTDEPATG